MRDRVTGHAVLDRGCRPAIAPSSWHGTLPAGAARITSPTSQLFLLGRWFPANGAARVTTAAGHTATPVNGWSIPHNVGTYTDPLVRAVTAQVGWGANVPAEALYAHATIDQHNAAFDGHNTYRMHFAAGQSPPVQAFWSITLYGPDHFLVANSLNRYAISTRTPGFKRAADGSYDIWIGSTPPASGQSNWLPAPAGPFQLTLRMYLPDAKAASGKYVLPRVQRVGA